jgi:hypothetical protein
MGMYDKDIESKMRLFYSSLNERDSRRYAAIESLKLGYGGISYISGILGLDEKTIQKGIEELKKTS